MNELDLSYKSVIGRLYREQGEINKKKVELVEELMASGNWLLRFPKIFVQFFLKPINPLHKEVTCIPSATMPGPLAGADVWTLDTQSGDMELLWVLPEAQGQEHMRELLKEAEEREDHFLAQCIRDGLSLRLAERSVAYNENFPYEDILKSLNQEAREKGGTTK
jgi:hypothetical protein